MYKMRKYFKRRSAIPRRRRYARKPRANTKLKALVKRMIAKSTEVKSVETNINNSSILTASYNSYTMLLPTSQGVGANNRVGNMICPKSLTIKGHVNMLPYDATTNSAQVPIMVVLWVVKARFTNSTTTAPDFQQLLQDNGSSGTFNQLPTDVYRSINTDNFIPCAKRVFKLGTAVQAYQAGGSGQSQGGFYSSHGFPYARSFSMNLTKFLKKQIKYNDTNNACTNDNLWLVAAAIQCNGGVVNQVPAEMHFHQQFKFTDA